MNKSLPLKCPCHRKADLTFGDDCYVCTAPECCHSAGGGVPFTVINEVPVLISSENTDTLCDPKSIKSYVSRSSVKLSPLKKLLVGESATTIDNCARFVDQLRSISSAPRVLVIGSGEQGSGTSQLWNDAHIEMHGVDIYASDTVDVVCDGHYLPLADESYDGVWIQAVLEHVVEPNKVADEIFRVLKPGGIVYAETPFMQQVHEGAYDFTRFTVLGHRYLFKNFEAIDFGGNKGPELVLAWSLRYFTWGITRSRKLARTVGVLSGLILRPFGRLMSKESMFDGPSGVYFLGKKTTGTRLRHRDLPALYKGAMR